MACGCGCGSPSSCGAPPYSKPVASPGPQDLSPEVRSSTARELPLCGTLARTMIGVADSLRDLYTTFGLRPYVVNLIKTRWTGGRRGIGAEILESDVAILPTPLISDLASVTEVNSPIGLDEIGEILVSQVSGSYTEDFLRGHDKEGRPVAADEQLYYEIEFPPPCEGKEGERRRFVLKGAPFYKADGFQWSLRLERARMDRARNGDPR